ncbi:tetratricopeptide repeat protein [Bradyrhizobium diazoefficiens]
MIGTFAILVGENALVGAALAQSTSASQAPIASLSDKELFQRSQDAIDRDDYRAAFAYSRELANRGSAPAQYVLGILYLNGNGVAQDSEQARYWLSKAAAQGYERATNKLAELGVKTVAGGNGASANSQQLAQSADAPTDSDIVELTRNRLREDSREAVRAHYGNLDKLGSGDVLQVIQGTTSYTSQAVLSCSANAPAQKDRCMAKLRDDLRTEREQALAKINSPAFIEGYIFAVQQKTNYEGNYVTFVDVRQRGTDHAWKWKMLLKFRSGRWTIAEKTEQEVH